MYRRIDLTMKKFLQNAFVPFAIFTGVILLIGCEPAKTPNNEASTQTVNQETINSSNNQTQADSEQATELKTGNMFYIIRDVADMQLKAGDYVQQLQQTQSDIQSAINVKDQQQLAQTTLVLKQQLEGFNSALADLNLKSTEINNIRLNLQTANNQVLASPLLNGQLDFSKIDFEKIEKQMGNIQNEMVKLASMLLTQSSSEPKSEP